MRLYLQTIERIGPPGFSRQNEMTAHREATTTVRSATSHFLFLLGLLCIGLPRLSAQPQISYIIPDIGTPGYNTYVEIIAPVAAVGTFDPGAGQTGVLPTSALEIELVNPSDSERVVISPGAVSWDGRLVSCQFFVHPDATPGPVGIRVRVNNQRSNVDTFFVVTPQPAIVGAANGLLGSGGPWGVRSKRGAMIVEGLDLRGGEYRIDTRDTDPGSPGNQGYLPAVIISIGAINVASGARIDLSATGKDGGPGGGGGGGYGSGFSSTLPPITIPGERNTPLGSGFTGGRSDVPIIPSPSSSFGTGSGADSRALNGATANDLFTTTFPTFARLYGAGPGHPFDRDGRSGGGAAATSNPANPFGTSYGGGGNGTAGSGVSAGDMNGQIVGNRQLVPLHGGGGGASGGSNDSVGAGGGGGLGLYSHQGAVIARVRADGADGADGCDGCGFGSGDGAGGGAGGSIIVGAKLDVDVGRLDADGGSAGRTAPSAVPGSESGSGGAGRLRIDGATVGNPQVTSEATFWRGPTTDTTRTVTSRLFTLRGTGLYANGVQTNIRIYVRGESTSWGPSISAPYTTTVSGDGTWEEEIALTNNDSVYYIFAVQEVPSSERGATDSATRIPSVIFSQTAANILRYLPSPDISVPAVNTADTVFCRDEIRVVTIPIRNRGDAELLIRQGGITLMNPLEPGFTIVRNPADAGDLTIPVDGIDSVIVRIDAARTTTSRTSVLLRIISNDPDEDTLDVRVSLVDLWDDWVETDPLLGNPIDFGDVRVGSSSIRIHTLWNRGPTGLRAIVDEVWIAPSDPRLSISTLSSSLPVQLSPDDSVAMSIEYSPTTRGSLTGRLFCFSISEPCVDTICRPIDANAVESGVELSKSEITYNPSICADPVPMFDTLFVTNSGTDPFSLLEVSASPAGIFDVVEPTVPPALLLGAGEQQRIVVRYTPGVVGGATGGLVVRTDDAAIDSVGLPIRATGGIASIGVTPSDSLVLESGCIGGTVTGQVRIENNGSVENAVSYRLARGTDFSVSGSMTVLGQGTSFQVQVGFTPMAAGEVFDTLFVESQPCDRRDTVIIVGRLTPANITIAPNPVDFLTTAIGSTKQLGVSVTYTGTGGAQVSGATITPALPGLTISPSTTFPFPIADGVLGSIGVAWSPSTLAPIPAGTILEVYLDEPCPDTIRVEIRGIATPGGLSALPSPLDFGARLFCEVARDTIIVAHSPDSEFGAIELRGIEVDPSDGIFTAQLLSSDPRPDLLPGDSVGIEVLFAPVVGPDGPRNSTLRILTSSAVFDTLLVPLRGVRFSESLSLAGGPFPTTFPGGSATQTFTITNDATAPIVVNALRLRPPFRLVAARPPLPQLLTAGGSMQVDIAFEPRAEGDFLDSMYVDGIIQCDSLFLPLAGESRAPETVTGEWIDNDGEPREEVAIALRLTGLDGSTETRSLQLDANFNPTMLLPLGIRFEQLAAPGWQIDNFETRAGRMLLEASGPTPLAADGTLLYLDALVLLGDATATDVFSSDWTGFTSGSARLVVDSGRFELEGYCDIGGARLVRITGEPGIKAVVPHPVGDRGEVEFETIEDGMLRLELFDLTGRRAALLVDEDVSPGRYAVPLPDGLPSGSYRVVLQTPTMRFERGVVVR